METVIPHPGSDEAINQGCICPIVDNHFGAGRPTFSGPEFTYVIGCPIHKITYEVPPTKRPKGKFSSLYNDKKNDKKN